MLRKFEKIHVGSENHWKVGSGIKQSVRIHNTAATSGSGTKTLNTGRVRKGSGQIYPTLFWPCRTVQQLGIGSMTEKCSKCEHIGKQSKPLSWKGYGTRVSEMNHRNFLFKYFFPLQGESESGWAVRPEKPGVWGSIWRTWAPVRGESEETGRRPPQQGQEGTVHPRQLDQGTPCRSTPLFVTAGSVVLTYMESSIKSSLTGRRVANTSVWCDL